MSIFQKLKQLFSTTVKVDITVSSSSASPEYSPISNEVDKYRFPTIESILNVNTSIPNIDYILQRKATQFKKEEKMDFAIACLKKSNDIMLASDNKYRYLLKDYMRYIKYLEKDGQFEKARAEEAVLRKKLPKHFYGEKTPNSHLKESMGDLVYFCGSRLCPLCSIYDRRVFSKSGKDTRFPPLSKLPKNLQTVNCPECGVYLGFSSYFAFNTDSKVKQDIKISNRPFVDTRTDEQKKDYANTKQKAILHQQTENEYSWIRENLPDIAPKSLSGYSRMKNSNSANYQKLLSLMKEKGFEI